MKKAIIIVLSIYYLGHGFPYPQHVIDDVNRPHINGMFVGSAKGKYKFVGYLKNTGTKVMFTSSVFEDTLKREFVLVYEGRQPDSSVQRDTSQKYTDDFDSLFVYTIKHSRPTYNDPLLNIVAGPDKTDTVWDTAVVRNNRWVFNRISGKITLFSEEPFSNKYSYMQIENEGTKKYNYDSIKLVLYKNKNSKTKLVYRELGIKSSVVLALSGLGLAIVGFSQSSVSEKRDINGKISRSESDSPLFFVGAGLLASSWVPYVAVKNNFIKAVYDYNF